MIDGQVNGGGGVDKFRIKIWDADNGGGIVYDNGLGAPEDDIPPTALGGGQIIIHSKSKSLRAAAGAGADGGSAPTLTYAALQPIVDQARLYWTSQGVDADQFDLLSQLDVRIADLPGSHLGMASASSNLIWIDRDAAGAGWTISGAAGYDLLSAVTHEFGHVVGLDHDDMGATLRLGQQTLPLSLRHQQLDRLFGSLGDSVHSPPQLDSSRLTFGVEDDSILQTLDRAEIANKVDSVFEGLPRRPILHRDFDHAIDRLVMEDETDKEDLDAWDMGSGEIGVRS